MRCWINGSIKLFSASSPARVFSLPFVQMLLHHNPPPEEEFYDGTHINLLWHLELLIMATQGRKEVGAPWDKQNGPPGSSGTDSVGPVTPRGVRCCITSIPSIREGGVEGSGGVHISGEPRLVTPLHTHCGGRAPAKYITALHRRWLRWNRITKYITALHRQWHQWNSY